MELGLIKKSGAWYEYNGSKIAQGRDAGKQYIADNADLQAELLNKIKSGIVE